MPRVPRFLVSCLVVLGALGAVAHAENIVHSERSLYRNIIVYDESGMRCMKFSRAATAGRQSCQFLRNPERLVDDPRHTVGRDA